MCYQWSSTNHTQSQHSGITVTVTLASRNYASSYIITLGELIIALFSFRLGNQVCGPSPMMHNKADIVVYYVSSNTENQRIELGQKKAHPLNK